MKCNFGILHVPKSRSTPQNHHKKQQGKQTNTNTKLQKVNNIQWDMANTTTNKRRKQRTENEKRKADEGKQRRRERQQQWHAACACVFIVAALVAASCTTPRGISRQNAKNVFTTKATRCDAASSRQQAASSKRQLQRGRSVASRRDGCSLLIAGALNGSAAL